MSLGAVNNTGISSKPKPRTPPALKGTDFENSWAGAEINSDRSDSINIVFPSTWLELGFEDSGDSQMMLISVQNERTEETRSDQTRPDTGPR
jgi:hypothetical protein